MSLACGELETVKRKAGNREAVEASIDAAKNDKDATYARLARRLPASIEAWESVEYPEADPRRPFSSAHIGR